MKCADTSQLGGQSIHVWGGYCLFQLQDISALSSSEMDLVFKLASPLKEIKLPIKKTQLTLYKAMNYKDLQLPMSPLGMY